MNFKELLMQNGYKKKVIKGEYNLIGNNEIETITDQLILNLNSLPDKETYLNMYRNPLNKVEIDSTVYSKGILNIEVINNHLFYYI